MKVNCSISLESKEIKAIIAKALDLPIENVISTHYGFAIQNISESELAEKLSNISK